MSDPAVFQSVEAYEALIYGLAAVFPSVDHSTLVVQRRGKSVAVIRGTLEFVGGRVQLHVRQVVQFAVGQILDYGYEVWVEGEKACWYDPQPHPDDPSLASTYPHHKHVPPDIKHNRQPAAGLSFEQPNLPFLIREIEGRFLKSLSSP
jgi:hypothetical protein